MSPEKVEGELIKNPLIAQAFVEGNSLESSVVAVVVLDEEVLTKWANGRAISVQDAYQDPVLKAKLLNEIKELSSSEPNVLNGFETPKAIHIEKEMFTPENGLLTSTFKIKREIARTQYSKVLDGLYKDLNKSFAPK